MLYQLFAEHYETSRSSSYATLPDSINHELKQAVTAVKAGEQQRAKKGTEYIIPLFIFRVGLSCLTDVINLYYSGKHKHLHSSLPCHYNMFGNSVTTLLLPIIAAGMNR